MMNPAMIFKLKGMWDQFTQNHPKFPMFLNAVQQNGIVEDSVMEIVVTNPDGQVMKTNIKVTASDIELIKQLQGMA